MSSLLQNQVEIGLQAMIAEAMILSCNCAILASSLRFFYGRIQAGLGDGLVKGWLDEILAK